MERASNKPHIVAVPFPGQGHMSPLLHLSEAIAARGFTVSYVNVSSVQEQIKKNLKAQHASDIRFESLPCEWNMPDGFDQYCLSNTMAFFSALEALEPALDSLIVKLGKQVSPVLAIISDLFLPWTQQVADKHGIPRVILMCATTTCFSIEYHSLQLAQRGLLPVKESEVQKQKRIKLLPGLSPMRMADIPLYLHEKSSDLPSVLNRRTSIEKASWVFVNSVYCLESEVFDALQRELGPKVVPVGPVSLYHVQGPSLGLKSEDERSIHWLNAQRESSVLYISFGSIAVLTVEQLQQIAEALESSQQPFLWVVKSRPENTWYEDFSWRTRRQGYVASWVPQLQVLKHTATGGFLTHCGWNSMLESMSNGVPMIGWPVASEQNLNCKLMVEDLEVAISVSKGMNGLVTKSEIERVIKRLLCEEEGEELRKRAKQVERALKEAVSEGGESVNNLEAFLDEIGSAYLR